MKQFLFFILKTLALLLLTMGLLDVLYTTVYLQSDSRTKIDYLYNSNNKDYDVVFLGSSRVNNHFVPKIFNDQGYKTFNFGITRSRLEESALMLKLMMERHYKIKTLILQVDLNINTNDHSEAIRSLFMPYLHQSQIIRDHYRSIPEYYELLYIPFYRYLHYDARVGFREMYASLVHKRTNNLDNDGFHPLESHGGKIIPADLSKYYPKKNVAYEEIKAICKANNIRLIAMTTPMCMSTINRDYFNHINSVYPEIYRFENAVTDDKYFSTCGHMNKAGAVAFTKVVFDAFFKPKAKP
ncbi:hypothetical protein EZL74_06040 [Flavobacterium silvisoli]|uniref:SGNH/GDSL hydrolase family protein n=1 Tax=Flavobacterium silvisoli TaxID=2529433 RepID=A0A4Q9Z164_9FLAO|nr:hypothetical protein [Flavobacterium silvisoli]TBX69977.1 hypothetical protein EZL74_06040 [Flavobacterium silvisoli]